MVNNEVTLREITGAAIRDLREQARDEKGRRMSQEALAREMKKFGFDRDYTWIAKTEAGKRSPTVEELFAFSHVFGVSVDYFFIPLPHHLDSTIVQGKSETVYRQPAHEELTRRIATPPGPYTDLAQIAYIRYVDVYRARGITEATKAIDDAIKKAAQRGP